VLHVDIFLSKVWSFRTQGTDRFPLLSTFFSSLTLKLSLTFRCVFFFFFFFFGPTNHAEKMKKPFLLQRAPSLAFVAVCRIFGQLAHSCYRRYSTDLKNNEKDPSFSFFPQEFLFSPGESDALGPSSCKPVEFFSLPSLVDPDDAAQPRRRNVTT